MKIVPWAMTILLPLALALPARGDGYKNTYPEACSTVWGAVKDTLGDQTHYDAKNVDNGQMSADYQIKNRSAIQVTGVEVERVNHVTLTPKGSGCVLEITPNYSGWSHYDVTNFRKRIEATLAKRKSGAAK